MKQIGDIIEDNLDEIQKYIQKGNYYACANISFDLLTISILSNFKKGIFISTILKNTFLQIDSIIEQYEFNEDERNIIKYNCEKNIQNLQKYYINDTVDSRSINALIEFSIVPTEIEYKYQKIKKQIS